MYQGPPPGLLDPSSPLIEYPQPAPTKPEPPPRPPSKPIRRALLAIPLLCAFCPIHLLGYGATLLGIKAWFLTEGHPGHTHLYTDGAWVLLGLMLLVVLYKVERRAHRDCSHDHGHARPKTPLASCGCGSGESCSRCPRVVATFNDPKPCEKPVASMITNVCICGWSFAQHGPK